MVKEPRTIGIRTKTKYLWSTVENRSLTPYWIKRLIENPPDFFYKYDQHRKPAKPLKLLYILIVRTPEEYIKEGIISTDWCIRLVGAEI